MIDDPDKTDRLVDALEASLPIETRLSASLIQTLSKRSPDVAIPAKCNVVSVFYMGEEGGIVCALDIGGPNTKTPHLVSITHLIFERKVPLFSQIDAYQRHRIKKLTGPLRAYSSCGYSPPIMSNIMTLGTSGFCHECPCAS